MGASLSSDVYQYKVDGHLEEIDHCIAIADDIIIYGFDKDGIDHDRTVRQVMAKRLWVCILTPLNSNSTKPK